MSWEKVRLGEILTHRKGFILIDDNKAYKLCRVQLHRRGVLLRNVQKASLIKTKKQQVCKSGDFLVAEMDAKFGGYGFVPSDLDGAIVSSHYFLFELNESKIKRGYLEVISQLGLLQEQIKAKGSTNYSAVRPNDVLNWEIPLPPIDKQLEIERLFQNTKGKIETLLSELTHQRALLTRLRQSILQDAVQGRLTAQWRQAHPKQEPASELLRRIREEKAAAGKKEKPLPPVTEQEKPFELPEGWVWCRLGECIEIKSNLVDPNKYQEYYQVAPESIEKNTGKLLFKRTVKESEIISGNHYFEANCLIYSKIRPKLNKVVWVDFEGLCSADMYPLKPRINPHFVKYSMLSQYFLDEVDKFDNRVKMPKINQNQLNQIPTPLPPLSEQTAIVAHVEAMLERVSDMEAESTRQRAWAEGLLQATLREAMGG